jgi:hypothetical protein
MSGTVKQLRELAGMGVAVTGKYLRQVADELEQAIAHDRQPYPTADAYEAACKALHAKEDEVKALVLRLSACLEGQEVLKAQTVRIRAALTDEVRDGVDTEEIARELRYRLDAALGALRDIYNTPPKLSEAQDQPQEWWVRLVDDIIGQAGNAIQSAGVETGKKSYDPEWGGGDPLRGHKPTV